MTVDQLKRELERISVRGEGNVQVYIAGHESTWSKLTRVVPARISPPNGMSDYVIMLSTGGDDE